ncbi:MAG: DUF58 domain-containing protein [Alphaproteobacteria bacterium]|nr:DUF58 domain-containing protein [Alphaproteobacteria bacterium]
MPAFLQNALNLRTRAQSAASDIQSLMLTAQKAADSAMHGERAQRKAGSGEKFWQFREYVQGDRPQDIDWRQSAKTQRIYIRQKEWQSTQNTLLWCSHSPRMDFTSGSWDSKQGSANIITMALTILIARAHEKVGLLNHAQAGRSEKTLESIANILCGKNSAGTLPSLTRPIPKDSAVILVSDFLDEIEEIKTQLATIAEQSDNVVIIQTLDPAELSLPYEGRVVFEGVHESDQETVQNVASIRAQYQTKITAHIEALKTLCVNYGWHYLLHKTDEAVSAPIAALWQEMQS